MPLPAVLTIQSGINQLRYATLKGIMAAKKKEIRKAAAASPRRRRAQTIVEPLRAREDEEDADHRRIAGGSREGARAQAARGSAGHLHDSGRRRTARRQAQSRDLGDDRGRAAAGAATAGRRSRCAVPGAQAAARPRRARRGAGAGGRHGRAAPALEPYTPDGYTAALQAAIDAARRRRCVLLPHTYQTRDFAPKLAARLDRAIITDVTGVKTRTAAAARSCGRCSRAS